MITHDLAFLPEGGRGTALVMHTFARFGSTSAVAGARALLWRGWAAARATGGGVVAVLERTGGTTRSAVYGYDGALPDYVVQKVIS